MDKKHSEEIKLDEDYLQNQSLSPTINNPEVEENRDEEPELIQAKSANWPNNQLHNKNSTFPVIVDVFAEISQNNYLPLFKLLQRALHDQSIDITEQNDLGYNVFHLLICTANFPIAKIVLENFPSFAFEKTRSQQSNLMLALNQKSFDIIKFIDERSHQSYAATDAFGFDIFMYMVRNNSILLFFYFLQKYLKAFTASIRHQADNINILSSHSNIESDDSDQFGKTVGSLNFQVETKARRELFKKSIFGLAIRDKNGCSLVHWAAFRDAEFLLRFFFRAGCDMASKDAKDCVPIERAVENNAFRAVHFLNSYSKYPFQTSYFLHNKFAPVEFDFLPIFYSKIESCFESEVLKNDFTFKRSIQNLLSFRRIKYLYAKYNLKYKIGLFIYGFWTFCMVFHSLISFTGVIQTLWLLVWLGLTAATSLANLSFYRCVKQL